MKSHFLPGGVAMVCALTGATTLVTEVSSAQTFTAADYATNSAYADGWQETDNGGFGFSPWSFYGSYMSATVHLMDSTSPYNQLGKAWTLFLPAGQEPGTGGTPNPPSGGDLSRAGRGFSPLQVGQTITTVFDNPTERRFFKGYTIALISGGQNVGYCCQGAVSRLRVGTFDYNSSFFKPGRWFVGEVGNTGIYDTNTAAAGASLAVTLTGPNNYKAVLTPLGNQSLALTNFGTLSASGAIDWIMFEHYNTDSDFYNVDDNGVTVTNIVSPAYETDFYVRSITISDVQPIAPQIGQQPISQSLYPGRTARFNVSAIGTSLSYRWRKDGSNLSNGGNISGALTDTLVVSKVSAADAAAYTVMVTNSLGSVTSAPPANLTLVQPSGSPYEAAVRAAQPVAYWRLNENSNPATNPPAFDYWGGFAGTYGNASSNGFNGILGPLVSDGFTGFESGNKGLNCTALTDQSWVTIPALNLNTNALTFTLWLNPKSDPIADYSGVIYTRRGTTTAAGVQYTLDNQIGYTVNNDPYTWQFESGLRPPANQWSFVAVVVEPAQATVYLYNTNGLASAVNPNVHTNVAWDGLGFIGGDPDNSIARTFDGKIDEVAVFNYAFTSQQISNLYNASLSVILNIQKVGPNVALTWPKGKLLEATNLTGPWATNNATSPYTNAPSGLMKFYRVKY